MSYMSMTKDPRDVLQEYDVEKRIVVSISLHPEILAFVDEEVSKHFISNRSEFIRYLIFMWMSKDMEKKREALKKVGKFIL